MPDERGFPTWEHAKPDATCRVRRDVDPESSMPFAALYLLLLVHRLSTERDDPDCK